MTGNPLEKLPFFDFRHVTSRLFVELRTMFSGTNFYFLAFVKEGYGTSFFSQRLIAHDARPKRIPRPAGNEHQTKSQYDMRKSVHWADHQEFAFQAYRGWMLRAECNGKLTPSAPRGVSRAFDIYPDTADRVSPRCGRTTVSAGKDELDLPYRAAERKFYGDFRS